MKTTFLYCKSIYIVTEIRLLDYLSCVPDFPKPGILFRDISPLIGDPQAFKFAITQFSHYANQLEFSHILAIESRGFIFASALAITMAKPLLLARKPNKLPRVSHRQSYGLEYGQDALEIQAQTIPAQAKVLIIDDVVATGGTLLAEAELMRQANVGIAGALSLLEISELAGNKRLLANGMAAYSLLSV